MSKPRRQRQDGSTATAARAPVLDDHARDAACWYLARQAKRFPELDIHSVDTSSLSAQDSAFAHAICDASIRRWLTLAHLLDAHLKRPLRELEPKLQGVLLAGAAQVVFLDRVPAHATINQGVEWAKQHVRRNAGGMVNAVLRRLSERIATATVAPMEPGVSRQQIPLPTGEALTLSDGVLPEDPVEALSVATSVPRSLIHRWQNDKNPNRARELAMHALAAPPVILNSSFADPDSDLAVPHESPGHHVFTGSHEELVALLARHDSLWVQDPASSLAVGSVTDFNPTFIVDYCAGLGTKTRQLARTFPNARIVATDVHQPRLKVLTDVFADSDQVDVMPMKILRETCLESADLILIDAPCSNTGVLARRPEARYRFGDRTMESLCEVQRQIIADSIPLLRAGAGSGQILFSTCSLEYEENGGQADWAERWHSLRAMRQTNRHPGGGPGAPATAYSDGAFATVLA